MNEQAYFFETIEYIHFKAEDFKDENGKTENRPIKFIKQERQSAVARFMEYFFGPDMMGKEVRTQWRQYEEYFDVLSDFVQSDFNAVKFMVQDMMGIDILLEFLMNNKPPYDFAHKSDQKPRMGMSAHEPSLERPFDLLKYLICSTTTENIVEKGLYPDGSKYNPDAAQIKFVSSDNSTKLISDKCIHELIRRTVHADTDGAYSSLRQIYQHLSWNFEKLQKHIITKLIEYIKMNKSQRKHMGTTFALLSDLLGMQDGKHAARYECLFNFDNQYPDQTPFLEYVREQSESKILSVSIKDLCLFSLKFLINTMEMDGGDYVMANIDKFREWTVVFLIKVQKEFIEKGNTYVDFRELISTVSLKLYTMFDLLEDETYKQFLVKIEEEKEKADKKKKEAQDKKMAGAAASKYPAGGIQSTNDELNMTNHHAGIPDEFDLKQDRAAGAEVAAHIAERLAEQQANAQMDAGNTSLNGSNEANYSVGSDDRNNDFDQDDIDMVEQGK